MKHKHELRLMKTHKLIAHAEKHKDAEALYKALRHKHEGLIWYQAPTRKVAR